MDLEALEQIRSLKYAYFRFLDEKRFDELGLLLTEDATSAYASGELSFEGREAIVKFLKDSLSGSGILSMHTGHHPEIELLGKEDAAGTWYLEDIVILRGADLEISGTALYNDRYTKKDGSWKISHTGYDRIFERQRKVSTGELISLTSRFDG